MSQRFCTQCGAKLPESGNFCPNCGAPVEEETVAAPAVAPPPAAEITEADSAAILDAELESQTTDRRGGLSKELAAVLAGAALVMVLLFAGYLAVLRPGDAGSSSSEAVTADSQEDADIPYPQVARITPDDAHIRLASDSAIFVDVRDLDSYTEVHIPGALSIPLDEIEARQGELPKDAEIITYCT
jgi:uncharacterized Zn finger protein (UPF0148 family)